MLAEERAGECNEFQSPQKCGSWPLIHLAGGRVGPDGRRVPGRARGIIAVGDHATGIVAIGHVARGLIAIGGAVSVGLISIGACPLGFIAVGVVGVGLIGVSAVPALLTSGLDWLVLDPQSWEIGGWLPLLSTWALIYFVFTRVLDRGRQR